jgi:hypothetical protein
LNSGYHGGVRFKVIETSTANIHNHEKRVQMEKRGATFFFATNIPPLRGLKS